MTGASNLAFLFIVISGAWLWMPRHWSRRQFAQVLWFRRGLSRKARDFNWHHVIGFWTLVPLSVVVASAVPISYPWASDALYRFVGDSPPPRQPETPDLRRRWPRGCRFDGGRRAWVALESLVTAAELREPDWRTMTIRLPDATDRTAAHGGPRQRRTAPPAQPAHARRRERHTGAAEAFTDRAGRARVARSAHTGEVFGVVGQTVAGPVSLGSLVYTGVPQLAPVALACARVRPAGGRLIGRRDRHGGERAWPECVGRSWAQTLPTPVVATTAGVALVRRSSVMTST
jgi:uncharacterized iron-regulated membrane protein